MSDKYECPVCLTNSLETPYKAYSYDICSMCGVEFGYDDAIGHADWTVDDWRTKAPLELSAKHAKLRKIWRDFGAKNWTEETKKLDFQGGVAWFDNYWELHPEEQKEWEANLTSGIEWLMK